MNTLYLLDAPDRDRHFHHYALSGLEKAGFSPLTAYFTGSLNESTLAAMDHWAISLALPPGLYKNFNPVPVLKLVRLIRKTNAQLLHVQRHRALIYAGLACLITGRPLIYTIRSTQLIRNRNRRFAFNIVSPAIARIVAVSEGARLDYLSRTSYPPEKALIVPNGIDIRPYRISVNRAETRKLFSMPKEGFIFGMAARFKKAKDHQGLAAAFAHALHDMPNAWLALAGDGPREKLIRETVKKFSIEKKVIFTGRLSPEDIPIFLKSIDVFVHPSFREGMPASVLEAMASCLPVIATDAEGVPDIFDTDKNFGRMVRKGDTAALEDAMREMYGLNDNQRKEMGTEAVKRLNEGFTRRHMADGIVRVYREVLKEYHYKEYK